MKKYFQVGGDIFKIDSIKRVSLKGNTITFVLDDGHEVGAPLGAQDRLAGPILKICERYLDPLDLMQLDTN